RTAVRRFDEVIYTPYSYDLRPHLRQDPEAGSGAGKSVLEITIGEHETNRLLPDIAENQRFGHDHALDFAFPASRGKRKATRFQTLQEEGHQGQAYVFLFEYGVGIFSLFFSLSSFALIA